MHSSECDIQIWRTEVEMSHKGARTNNRASYVLSYDPTTSLKYDFYLIFNFHQQLGERCLTPFARWC